MAPGRKPGARSCLDFVNKNKVLLCSKGWGVLRRTVTWYCCYVKAIRHSRWNIGCRDQAWKQGDQTEIVQERDVAWCHQ